MNRRALLKSAVALALAPRLALAQAFPSKAIRIVNPFSAGGGLDQLARNLAQKMAESLGQAVVVENRTGAGGNIGADIVAKEKADGYTLLMGSSATHGISPALYGPRLPFDPVKDFTAISVSVVQKNVLVVNSNLPARNVAELIAYARANPGKLSFGSPGAGTSQHLSGELFKHMAKVDMVHVPYKGSAAAMTDLLGDRITMMFTDIPTAIPHIKTGRLRALGVTSAQPSPALPDVKPIAEQGLPGFDLKAWYGVMAPAKLPPGVAEKLNAEITKALTAPDMHEKLMAVGQEPIALNLADSDAYVKTEIARWAEVVKISGAKLE
ncbi:MAG TPA: tripartite tricarboxylate transporter substrate binding protein [Usitatibacteraceae bacterium]|nr:tripartite tricarboxylate transporter substrate binding protein [Usitatibacteraceae bacterium]